MKILEFNIDKGIYHFEVDSLNTAFHSHPVVEIIYSSNGKFNLQTKGNSYNNISFAVIKANVKHNIIASESDIQLLMIECYTNHLFLHLERLGLEQKDNIYLSSKNNNLSECFSSINTITKHNNLRKILEPRVEKCLNILDNDILEYNAMMSRLSLEVSLSESRISHLFKDEIGIPLKKYLLWVKTKRAMQSFLEGSTLTEVAHQHGFFDQAHLSNAFLKFLGIRPSKKYNSGIIQF